MSPAPRAASLEGGAKFHAFPLLWRPLIGRIGGAGLRAAHRLAVCRRTARRRRGLTARVLGRSWRPGFVFRPGLWDRPGKMVLGGCPVSYLLLCGQAALLLGNLLLLHCVSRSHSFNATAEVDLTPSGSAHPEGPPAPSWEYSDPQSPVILCSYL